MSGQFGQFPLLGGIGNTGLAGVLVFGFAVGRLGVHYHEVPLSTEDLGVFLGAMDLGRQLARFLDPEHLRDAGVYGELLQQEHPPHHHVVGVLAREVEHPHWPVDVMTSEGPAHGSEQDNGQGNTRLTRLGLAR